MLTCDAWDTAYQDIRFVSFLKVGLEQIDEECSVVEQQAAVLLGSE